METGHFLTRLLPGKNQDRELAIIRKSDYKREFIRSVTDYFPLETGKESVTDRMNSRLEYGRAGLKLKKEKLFRASGFLTNYRVGKKIRKM